MSETENSVSSLADLKDLTAGAPEAAVAAAGEEAPVVVRTGPAAPLREREVLSAFAKEVIEEGLCNV